LWGGETEHLAAIIFHEVNSLGHIGIGLSPTLRDFVDHPGGKLKLPAAHNRGGLEEVVRPF
jgi:hypothetical protein